ncbi:hypothetical protein Tco_0069619, partial [Tanacetum coccineum]
MIKKRQHSRFLKERSPTVACLSAYAMHRARSKATDIAKISRKWTNPDTGTEEHTKSRENAMKGQIVNS